MPSESSAQSPPFVVSSRLRGVRALGHVCWWIFVVTRILPENPATGGMPRRYADYLPLTRGDHGWTAYSPLASPGFVDLNILATASLIAFVVTVGAALVEAVLCRRWVPGILTVVAPVVGGAIVAVGSAARYGGVWDGVWLRPALAAGIVLIGVAVREVWARGRAPAAARRS
ncbi:hypothetical protein [Gordonia hydrophobica]|uniref:Integral membrane protein n=1 Tax=Gordonia hydrophobica TaxID=40516 RepID=A0ABZ2TZY3_9ACTN|nr:hypothetical protein [Gordonia hydrophobica]MBM7369463.1 hypothetical protein [Gordonia hydrophobica]